MPKLNISLCKLRYHLVIIMYYCIVHHCVFINCNTIGITNVLLFSVLHSREHKHNPFIRLSTEKKCFAQITLSFNNIWAETRYS